MDEHHCHISHLAHPCTISLKVDQVRSLGIHLQLTTYYLLLTTDYWLLTTYYLLLTTDH